VILRHERDSSDLEQSEPILQDSNKNPVILGSLLMRKMHRLLHISRLTLYLCTLPLSFALAQPDPLQIYTVDVEGRQATLVVSASRQSLLIDTGSPGDRDVGRILDAAKLAGVKQLDYVIITHYHRDHVGGLPELAERIKIRALVDHGPNQEEGQDTREDFAVYEKVAARTKRITVRPGDELPIDGITVRVLTAAGAHITEPLPGGGKINPYRASEPRPPVDTTENARSVGVLITYGKFRMIDLGDLTKDKELELACPSNLIGPVDLFIVTHHGIYLSNAKALVWSLHPRVAIMNNSAHKGASPEAWQIVHDSPGLDDLWQLHYAMDGGAEHNVAEEMIANFDESPDKANYIKVNAESDGDLEVMNSRTGVTKKYRK
jgi:competence protein ComEC